MVGGLELLEQGQEAGAVVRAGPGEHADADRDHFALEVTALGERGDAAGGGLVGGLFEGGGEGLGAAGHQAEERFVVRDAEKSVDGEGAVGVDGVGVLCGGGAGDAEGECEGGEEERARGGVGSWGGIPFGWGGEAAQGSSGGEGGGLRIAGGLWGEVPGVLGTRSPFPSASSGQAGRGYCKRGGWGGGQNKETFRRGEGRFFLVSRPSLEPRAKTECGDCSVTDQKAVGSLGWSHDPDGCELFRVTSSWSSSWSSSWTTS